MKAFIVERYGKREQLRAGAVGEPGLSEAVRQATLAHLIPQQG